MRKRPLVLRALLAGFMLVAGLPGRSQAQNNYEQFPGLLADDVPLLQATVRRLRQQGIRAFMVYEPRVSYGDTSFASATYLLWTDGHAAWTQLIRPRVVYQPLRLSGAGPFIYSHLAACGAVKQEGGLNFTPPVVGGGNGLVAYTGPRATWYFEIGETPAGYVPQPRRQAARRQLAALLDQQLASLGPRQRVLRPYRREDKPAAGLFGK